MKIERRSLLAVLVLFTLLVAAIGGGATLAQETAVEGSGAQEAEAGGQPAGDTDSSEKAGTPGGEKAEKGKNDECDPQKALLEWPESFRPADVLAMLWGLGADKCRLARATLIAIAFLVAFLTVIAIWEIPPAPAQQRQAEPSAKTEGETTAGVEGEPTTSKTSKPSSVFIAAFESNFGRAVLSGLGGLVAVEFIDDSLWTTAKIEEGAFYVVLYVLLFVTLLVVFAFAHGVVEATRSRATMIYYWQMQGTRKKESDWCEVAMYWLRRFWSWLLSWQSTALIFFETVLNAVQGRIQGQGAGFHQTIVNLHRSQIWAAERIRHEVDAAILSALKRVYADKSRKENMPMREFRDADVRTSISVLNGVRQSLIYIAWERGSLWKTFSKKSIAWFVATVGVARWVKVGNPESGSACDKRFESYCKANLLAGEPPPRGFRKDYSFKVEDWLENRPLLDYQAFMMLPIPWSRRDQSGHYRNAALHISFSRPEYMDALWEGLVMKATETTPEKPNYEEWKGILEEERDSERDSQSTLHIKDPELRAVLHQAVEALGEMLRFFNPRIFEEDILPHMVH